MESLLTKAEVARLLRVSGRTVDEYREKGLFPSYTVCKKVLFKKEEVLKALQITLKIKRN